MSGGEEKVGGDPPGQQQEFNPFSEAGHVCSYVGVVHRAAAMSVAVV